MRKGETSNAYIFNNCSTISFDNLLIIVFVVFFVLVFVLREKQSLNKHKKNLQYDEEVNQNNKKDKK